MPPIASPPIASPPEPGRTPSPAEAPRVLLVVNAALLVLLGVVTFNPLAPAQVRQRGTYTMAAGGVNGSLAAAVYIVDTTNQEMIAVTYDPSQQELIGVGFRDLAEDAGTSMGGVSR